MKYLNLGCGVHFHAEWTNVDFVSTGEGVIAYNLTQGVPFEDNTFDVVYHSHVLEHFTRDGGKNFMLECCRVLKPNGIIRIAIPNLEAIINNYKLLLEQLKANPDDAYLQACYDWTMLEMYDQTVRNASGGEMVNYLSQDNIINEDFVIERCGYEVKYIIDNYRKDKKRTQTQQSFYRPSIVQRLVNLPSTLKRKLLNYLLGSDTRALKIGQFRLGGEIHSWMYDSFSLGRLLKSVGFEEIKECTVYESGIPNWNNFGLEIINGKIRKPDSLFIEARKK